MWERVAEKVELGEVDLLVHNGDQVYADKAFKEAMEFVEANAGLSDEEYIAKATEFYARIYRSTWSHPPTRQVLANISNLCMWDDHEIRNDWGAFDKDRDKSTMNFKMGLAARRAFWLYQRQLWDDMEHLEEKESSVDTDGYCLLLPGGHIGLIFVDSRGSRSFYADDCRPFVSDAQWNMLHKAMSPGGLYNDTTRILIVHTMPVVLIGTQCSAACPCIVGGEDKMGFGVYPDEQEEYLQLINDWVYSTEHKGSREVLLLGGDLHFSMESEVNRASDGKRVLRQVVTSAMANKPPCCWQYYPMKLLAMCCRHLGQGTYQFTHNRTKPVMNFGHFNLGLDLPEIQYEIVTASDPCCNTRGLLYC